MFFLCVILPCSTYDSSSWAAVQKHSVPLEPKIAGALKTQLSNVALHKHSVVRTTYGKLHAVAALYLKGHIIGGKRYASSYCLYGGEKLPFALPPPLPER